MNDREWATWIVALALVFSLGISLGYVMVRESDEVHRHTNCCGLEWMGEVTGVDE